MRAFCGKGNRIGIKSTKKNDEREHKIKEKRKIRLIAMLSLLSFFYSKYLFPSNTFLIKRKGKKVIYSTKKKCINIIKTKQAATTNQIYQMRSIYSIES